MIEPCRSYVKSCLDSWLVEWKNGSLCAYNQRNWPQIGLLSIWKFLFEELASETAGETGLRVQQQRSELWAFMTTLDTCVWVEIGGTRNDMQHPGQKLSQRHQELH